MSFAKRSLFAGLIASACAHALAGWLLHLAGPARPRADEPAVVLMEFDIHEPPAPPQAEMPVEGPAAAPPVETSHGEAPIEPSAPEEPAEEVAPKDHEPEPAVMPDDVVATGALDAGVPDAALVVAEQSALDAGADGDLVVEVEAFDAGAADAGAIARLDTSDLDQLMTSSALDTAATAGERMQTPAGAAPGIGQESAGSEGAAPHSPARANLLGYMPEGELLAILVRFDRLRDTEWAGRTEAILAPMPDYRALIGGRSVSLGKLFHSLVISSPAPRDVTATTLVGHTVLEAARLRSFLDHPAAQVDWRVARGGALGVRRRSRLIAPDDPRVFLMPFANWVVLSRPDNLGSLVQPASGDLAALDARMHAHDSARDGAPTDELPAWLAQIRGIEGEAGRETGPALLLTVARLLPPVWEAPYIGETLAIPERMTLALEVTDKGFFVRGTMAFADADTATGFVRTVERVQRDFVGTRVGEMVLSRFKAYNAVRGLTLVQNQALVGFATSISIADARAAMDFAAEQTRLFFGRTPQPEPTTPPAPE